MTTSSKHLSLLELVFEKRNKSYGAYVIRKVADKLLLIGLFMTISFFLLAFMTPEIFGNKKSIAPVFDSIPDETVIALEDPPKIIREDPTTQNTFNDAVEIIKNLVPAVVNDKLILIEDSLADHQKLLVSNIGNKSQRGDTGVGYMGDTTELGNEKKKADPPVVYEIGKVPVKPQFRNGDADLITYIGNNVVYPAYAKEIGIEGTVYVQFVIDAAGNVTETEIKKGIDPLLNNAALKVISNMPSWKPGMQNDHAVAVRMIIPIKFEIIH